MALTGLLGLVGYTLGQTGAGFDLTWSTVDTGGTTASSGGGYTLGGTTGQHDAGPIQGGGRFGLAGGFWGVVTDIERGVFDISWFTVDGGGNVLSSGGEFSMGGTTGQPDAGHQNGGGFSLTGGFWNVGVAFAVDPPDFDVPPTPLKGTTFTMNAGESLQFTVQASDVNVKANVTQISAGNDHTCVLLDTGVVRCWGWGGLGQLGYRNIRSIGDDETPATAGDVPVGGTVAQIDAGKAHTCAVLDTGAVRCWGSGGFSNLGYGNTGNIGDDETPASVGDVDVGGTVTQIAAGTFHTCALLDTGAVRCWGFGTKGRLGYATTTPIGDDEPPATAGDVDVGGTVVQIVAGEEHTCALLDTGAVRCWGVGANGRLGYGNTNDIGDDETPAAAGDVDVGGAVVQIDAGVFHTCALLDTGAVRCWGAGGSGRLGYGNSITIGDDETPATAGDVDVGGTVVQIDAGSHTCALLDTRAVRCWGVSANGRLGYGNLSSIGDNETPASAGDVDIVDPGDVVTLSVVGLPAAAVFATGTPANPVSATFSWVPTGADVGSHPVTFTAQDSTGLSATPHAVNIEVQQAIAVPGVTPWAVAALAGAFVLLLAWGLRRRAVAAQESGST